MGVLQQSELATILLAIAVLLSAARIFGEAARRLHQPAIVGEILAGILLGPTVLGALQPAWNEALFPTDGGHAALLDGLVTLAITLFLLVAGTEVDLSSVRRQGSAVLKIGAASMVVPALLGFAAAWLFPEAMGSGAGQERLVFALFIGIALAISALPVIARTLIDLDLYRTDLGMLIVSVAALNDLVGWLAFAVILSLLGPAGSTSASGLALTTTVTLAFAAGMLTVGRWLIDRGLAWVQKHTSWPTGVISFALSLALFSAAFTEWLGLHAVFGAFLVGVAIGDSPQLRQQTRTTIDHFVSSFFTPLFFASIGLRLDFVAHFDLSLTVVVFVLACVGKLCGAVLGGRWSSLRPRDSWGVGVALNARGAMEIVLGLLALKAGLIDAELFVALVIMALGTSVLGGFLLRAIFQRPRGWRLADLLGPKNFVLRLAAGTREQALEELVAVASGISGLDEAAALAAVRAREEAAPTGMEHGLALPHARIPSLTTPIVVAGLSARGIDFDAPDGSDAHVVVLILTPRQDQGAQLEIMSAIARGLRPQGSVERALQARNLAGFLEVLREGVEHEERTLASEAARP